MELSSSYSSFFILLTTLIAIVVIKLISLGRFQATYWKKKNVPTASNFPMFITLWKIFLRRMNFKDFSLALYQPIPEARYIGTMDFGTPMLVVRDPELVKEIAVKQFDHFTDHRAFVEESVDPIFGKNIFSLRGERWKEMRNTLSPSFTASKMRFMFDLVSACSRQFVNYFEERPNEAKEIEIKDAFTRYTNDVIATVAFGISVNSLKDKKNPFFVKGAEATDFSGVINFFKFTLLRACPNLMKFFNIGFLKAPTAKFFNEIIRETLRTRKEKKIVRPDMIQLLIQAREKDTSKLDIQDIVAQAFIFFLAGFDTSSTLMCFMAHELAVNPDIQKRLCDEIDKAFERNNGELSYQNLSEMEYMDMVINETLRMYPPVIFMDRICVKPTTFPPPLPGGTDVLVEEGTGIWFPTYGFHHDPQYFPNPETFDPERFNAQNKDNVNPYTYIPFGLGPRKCIGERFALMETKILIVQILRKFVIKTTSKTVNPVVYENDSFNLKIKGGFWIGLEPRKN